MPGDEPRTTTRDLPAIPPAPPIEGAGGGGFVILRADAFYLGVFVVIALVCLAYLLGRFSARQEQGSSSAPVVLRSGNGSGMSPSLFMPPVPGPEGGGTAGTGTPQGSAGTVPNEVQGGPPAGAGPAAPQPAAPVSSAEQPAPNGGPAAGLPSPVTAWYIQPLHTLDEREAKAVVVFLQQQGLRAFYKKSPSTRIFVINVGPYPGQDREIFERVRTLKYQGRVRFRDAFWIAY